MVYQIHNGWVTDTSPQQNKYCHRTSSDNERVQTARGACEVSGCSVLDANLNYPFDWLRALEQEASFFNELSMDHSCTNDCPSLAPNNPAELFDLKSTSDNAQAMFSAGDVGGPARHLSKTLLPPMSASSSSSPQAGTNPETPIIANKNANIVKRNRELRRREQNRKSQQAFRRRKEEQLVRLQSEVEQLREELEGFQNIASHPADSHKVDAPIETMALPETTINCHICGAGTTLHAAQTIADKCDGGRSLCDEVNEEQDECLLQGADEWWQYFMSPGVEP